MAKVTTLPTALEIALSRTARAAAAAARQQKAEAKRAEWQRRLDPAAYSCRRDGDAWIAEGPAGQRFEFRLGARYAPGHYSLQVASQSGSEYALSVDHNVFHCSCPAAERSGGCKHEVAYVACKQAARMERQLPAEAEKIAA